MLAQSHRQAAEDIEQTILQLQGSLAAARIVIEGHGEQHFTGLPLAVKRSTIAIRRAMHVWELSSVVRRKWLWLNGGKLWIVYGKVDGMAKVLILRQYNLH
ncbi:MAG TPA: hypothetical protein VKR06_24330 [Ktedonosporobacter sp.]|nr:hypothetical protein [Ktedonosporobacter sp.]